MAMGARWSLASISSLSHPIAAGVDSCAKQLLFGLLRNRSSLARFFQSCSITHRQSYGGFPSRKTVVNFSEPVIALILDRFFHPSSPAGFAGRSD